MRSVPRPGRGRRSISQPARQQPFSYGSRWRRLRRIVLAAEPACRVCGRRATEVHHVVPVIVDLSRAYEVDNLMPLCRACHDAEHGGGDRRG